MKKTFTDEELEAVGEEEPEEQSLPENEAKEPRARESDDGANSDEELPEVFTMTEGKSMAQKRRGEERASGRRIAAEVKKKKQVREATRKSEKASGKLSFSALENLGKDDTELAEKNGLLDDSIVQFLSERERTQMNEKMELSPAKESFKVKRLKSKKELSNGRVQVIDLSRDTSFVEEHSALEFKNGHLYGNRIKRDASMLRTLARVS